MDEEEAAGTAKVIEASAKVVEAAAKLVEQVNGVLQYVKGGGGGERSLLDTKPGDSSDSAGWLEQTLVNDGASVDEARKAVVDRSTAYYLAHQGETALQTTPDQNEIGRIYLTFFSPNALAGNFSRLKEFQKAISFFEPSREGLKFGDLASSVGFPDVPHDDSDLDDRSTFRAPDPAWTVTECIGRLMASSNIDPAIGKAIKDRSKGLTPAWLMKPTHAQCVIYHHVLFTQEDVQLVAPYSGQVW